MKNTAARKARIMKENEFLNAVAENIRAHLEEKARQPSQPGETMFPGPAAMFLQNYASRYPELSELQNAINKLNGVLLAGQKAFAPRRQLEQIRREGLAKIEAVYRDAVKRETLEHMRRIVDAQSAYEKASTAHPERELLTNVRNQQNIQAMSADELKLHAQRFIDGQGTYSPEYLNLLSGELKRQAGPEDSTFQHLRIAMQETRSSEPWLELPGVDQADDLVNLYTTQKIPAGSFAIPSPPNSGEGPYGIQAFPISDAVVPLPPEDK